MFQKWLDRFTEMLRELGAGRPRARHEAARRFHRAEEGEELILPNPHDEDER